MIELCYVTGTRTKIELHSIFRGAWPERDRKCRDTCYHFFDWHLKSEYLTKRVVQNYLLLRSVGEDNVRAADDLNKRRIYDLSELFCVPQVRYNGSWILFPPHIQTLLSPRYSPKPPMIKRFHKGNYENLRRHLRQHLSHLLKETTLLLSIVSKVLENCFLSPLWLA